MAIHLLFVDDSAAALTMYTRIVQVTGLPVERIFTAGSGRQALDILARERVDLVVTDLHMPEMDGFQFLAAVKGNPALAALPVVLITSESRPRLVQQAADLGAAAVLQKPFQPEEIRRVITGVLGVQAHGQAPTDSSAGDF